MSIARGPGIMTLISKVSKFLSPESISQEYGYFRFRIQCITKRHPLFYDD